MATVSFNAPLEAEPEVKAEAPTDTIAVRDDADLAPAALGGNGDFVGDFEAGDMGSKWLNLVPRAAEEGIPGNYRLAREHDLGDSVNVVFRKVAKFFLEDLSTEQVTAGKTAERFDRLEVAQKAGFTLQGVKGQNKICKAADIDLFVQLPADHPAADFVVGAHGWAAAKFRVKKNGFTAVVNTLTRDWVGWLKGDLSSGVYVLGREMAEYLKFKWYSPTVKPAGKLDEETHAALSKGFNIFED